MCVIVYCMAWFTHCLVYRFVIQIHLLQALFLFFNSAFRGLPRVLYVILCDVCYCIVPYCIVLSCTADHCHRV
jgi:hypothetical protein